jgi:hypothetical protein
LEVDVRLDLHDPPRVFEVGTGAVISLRDCGDVRLEADEQLTLLTESGAEYDVARKDWGFYATPSLNGRLERFGLRGVLVKNRKGQYFVLLVERGREPLFERYLAVENLTVLCWLDHSAALEELERKVRAA